MKAERKKEMEATQMSMLPSPMEDERLRTAAIGRLRVAGGEDRPYSVVGEKHFKNPLLFPPPKTKGLDKPRKIPLQGNSSTDDGEDIERCVEILGNNVTSGYTTETLRVLTVINEMWEQQGYSPDGGVYGSFSEVVRRLGKDENNAARHRKAVATELQRLRRLPLIFSQYFTKDMVKKNHEITYFCDYQYVTDRTNPSNNYFRAKIDPHVLENIREGYISSLPSKTIIALKYDNSGPVLLKVDSVLASMERLELSSDTVYALTQIELTDWTRKPVNRKKTLENIRSDIDQSVLSSGWVVNCSLVTDAKGDNIKLVFMRGERMFDRSESREKRSRGLTVVNTDGFVVQDLTNEMGRVVGEFQTNEKLYTLYAKSYPEEMLRRAMSEFKADKPKDLRSGGAFFSAILKRLVQESSYAWINAGGN